MVISQVAKLSAIIAVFGILLGGCSALNPPKPGDPRFAPSYPDVQGPEKPRDGGIYSQHSSMALYEDKVARRVGDILTIRLEERTNGQVRARSRNRKNSDTDSPNPTFFGYPSKNFSFKFGYKQDFQGEGESNQSNQLTGNISVHVAKVLPNGNLIVRGESWIKINQAKEYVRLTGIVRPEDISANNIVSSQRVANARVSYAGTGQVADSNRQGWLARFFSKLWPF